MRCCWRSFGRAAPIFLLSLGFASAQTTAAGRSVPYPPNNTHPDPAWFVNVAQSAGLVMENVNGGVDSKKYIIETTGSGVAIIDYDNDGWPDIFLVNGTTLDET